ncbi:SEC31A [Symbiodinium natans]|uniref:SEC31A protein n=1 Tax=Symbiodinium natans TaxID=878477 RepID=A0A812MLV6_9DINO|nr:SEC31A [Symbiodinium natans]
MAEALLLASGGGITLWTRARDEYLRLQGDTFLTTVGNIMTNDFSKLVANSNLAHWMETLAIVATYSGREYQALCEQLAERLEKEKFDIRSALICYICAKNFPKTVSIWAITHVASQGSQNLALQDLVEKMAVLQDVTKFQQAKREMYAEILANSGRLTAAMRYLCLLPDDNSSATLRDRIFNSAPAQMGQMPGALRADSLSQVVIVHVM